MLAPLELGLEDRAMSKSDELRHGAPGETAVHLCVDMQRMFAEETEWKMPWLERVLPNVLSITSTHPERTIFTRFIPAQKPGQGAGMWRHDQRMSGGGLLLTAVGGITVGIGGPALNPKNHVFPLSEAESAANAYNQTLKEK